MTVTKPPAVPPKRPHEFWIDLPLCTPDNVLGKVTLDCDPRLLPEKFEMLKVLSSNTATQLGAFTRKERLISEREEYIERSAAERVMASIAHNLNSRVAALPGLLTLYKKAECQPSLLPEVNRDFQHVLQNVLRTVSRTKELLAAITIEPGLFDAHDHLRTTLRTINVSGSWRVIGNQEPLEVQWDSHKVGSAILELVRNSQQASNPVRIEIEIESFAKGSVDWVRVIYRDDGPGIPAGLKDVIFEHFFTRKSPEHSGTGLGLWFVRRVVGAHGGTIREQGDIGSGAKFVMELPRWAIPQEVR